MTTLSDFKEPDLRPVLKEIIKPEHHNCIEDWLVGARNNEKKGLYLISKIVMYKGEGNFVDNKTLKPETDINAMNLKAAYERYKKRSTSTTYKTDYVHGTKTLYKNVFQERDIGEIQYCDMLNPLVVQYIRNWLRKENSENYKDMVLDFLRAFYSTINSNKKFVTMNHTQFNKYKPHENYTKEAFFSEGKFTKQIPFPTVDELRKVLKIDELKEKIANIPPINYNDNLENNDFKRQKKEELVRGQKNLLKGIYGSTTTTVYQESFKGHPEKFKYYFKPDFFTSGVKGKIPDPYTTRKMEERSHINDVLASRVKGISFN